MFKLLKKFFFENDNLQKELQTAISLHLSGKIEAAKTKYEWLYYEFKKNKDDKNLAIVINNLISLEHKKEQNLSKLYDELLELRFKLFVKNEEQFAKDYIYTLIMGVDWFNKPHSNLKFAKKLLHLYKNEPFYKDAMQKITQLEALTA